MRLLPLLLLLAACTPVTLRSGGSPLLLNGARVVPGDAVVALRRGAHEVELLGRCEVGTVEFSVGREPRTVEVPRSPAYVPVRVLGVGPGGAEVHGAVELDGAVLGATGEWIDVPACAEYLVIRATGLRLGEVPLQPLVDADAVYFVRLEEGEPLVLSLDAEEDGDALLSRPRFGFPEWAQELGVEGAVLLQYFVEADGATVARSDPRCPGAGVAVEPGAGLWHPDQCVEARAGRLDLVPETLAVGGAGRWAPWAEAEDGYFARLRVVYRLLAP